MNRVADKHEGPKNVDWNRARFIGTGIKTGRRYDLRSLRVALGKTQIDVARAAKMAQGDVSKLEDRVDVKLSTIERYASALGGEVEVAVVIDGRRYQLALDE
jgi:autotransporter translocation and assembly factor TamB